MLAQMFVDAQHWNHIFERIHKRVCCFSQQLRRQSRASHFPFSKRVYMGGQRPTRLPLRLKQKSFVVICDVICGLRVRLPQVGLFVRELFVGHNYIGHNYIGHNYIGHNYIGQLVCPRTARARHTCCDAHCIPAAVLGSEGTVPWPWPWRLVPLYLATKVSLVNQVVERSTSCDALLQNELVHDRNVETVIIIISNMLARP